MVMFGGGVHQTEESGGKSRETREGSRMNLNSVMNSVNVMCL